MSWRNDHLTTAPTAPTAAPVEGEAEGEGEGEGEVGVRRHVTVVGDLNAINPDTYSEKERMVMDRHNRGVPCPTDAVEVSE